MWVRVSLFFLLIGASFALIVVWLEAFAHCRADKKIFMFTPLWILYPSIYASSGGRIIKRAMAAGVVGVLAVVALLLVPY